MILIEAGEERELVYYGDFVPFEFLIVNMGAPDAEVCLSSTDKIDTFAIYDTIYNERRYWMTWKHNHAIIKNTGLTDVQVIGDGIFVKK